MGAPGEEGDLGEERCENCALGEERSTSTAPRPRDRGSGVLGEESELGAAVAGARLTRHEDELQQEVAGDGMSRSAHHGPLSGTRCKAEPGAGRPPKQQHVLTKLAIALASTT